MKTLTSGIAGTARNVTVDNYFTSVPLAEHLLRKNLTVVRTMRMNKREIPKVMKPNSGRQVNSRLFAFTKEMTMVSFSPK